MKMIDPDGQERWEEILEYQSDTSRRGLLGTLTTRGIVRNPTCGDQVRLGVQTNEKKVITVARYEAEGCVVSQAAAAILCEYLENKTLDEIRDLSPQEMLALLGVPLTATRQRCGLLAWEALQQILLK